jgi:uncharacterized protein YcbK (DUF882 family)
MGGLDMVKDTKNFKVSEFACPCGCGKNEIKQSIIDLCQKVRDHFKVPVKVTSGYRCPKHNASLEGSAKNSQHLLGTAADLVVTGITPDKVYYYCDKLNPKGGVGKYSSFTHIDTRYGKARWVV